MKTTLIAKDGESLMWSSRNEDITYTVLHQFPGGPGLTVAIGEDTGHGEGVEEFHEMEVGLMLKKGNGYFIKVSKTQLFDLTKLKLVEQKDQNELVEIFEYEVITT